MKDSDLNPISSLPKSSVYDGNNGKPVKVVYTIINPDGSSDDVQYSDINKATKALTEIDDLNAHCVVEAYQAIEGKKTDEAISEWVWDNIEEIGKELGYRLNEILK